MFQLPTQSRSVIEVFKDSFKLFKVVFVRCLPWTITMGILQLISRSAVANAAPINAGESGLSLLSHFPLISNICNILSFFVSTYLIYQILHFMRQEKVSFKDIITKNTTRGLLAVVSYAVFIIGVIVACIIIYLILHFLQVFGVFLAVVIILIGLLYIGINLFCLVPLIIDGKNPVAAFRMSFQLVKNNWWRTFGLLLLMLLVVYVFTTVISFLTGTHISYSSNLNQQMTSFNYITLLILPILTAPWSISVILLQMHNLQLAQAEKKA